MISRNIHQNSIVAFHALDDLRERQMQVKRIIEECPGASAPEIFRIMRARNYPIQERSVTPRLTELVDLHEIRIVGQKVNRLTGRKVNMYAITEAS